MKETIGKAIIYQTKEGKIIRRQTIETFAQEELKNLAMYGDLIAIDPTFSSLTTDWSIIPLTVINEERKIKSGGIIFTSHNKAEIFKWILKLLVLKLPCKEKIKTVCSGDDLALDSAFQMILENDDITVETDSEEEETNEFDNDDTENKGREENIQHIEYDLNNIVDDNDLFKQRMKQVGRVICYWHKVSNFNKFLNRKQTKNKAIKCFTKIGFSRDIKYVKICIEELKGIDDKIRDYFERKVEPKLQYMAKSYLKNAFTCGYITSSIAESTNNKIKRQLNGGALTLIDMRKKIDSIQLHDDANDYNIKARKKHKEKNPLIIDLMTNLKITNKIAEAIVGSIQKLPKITLIQQKDTFEIIEQIKNDNGEFDHQETFEVKNGFCSCNKFYQAGIHCSHQLKVIQILSKEINITPNMIHKRWINDKVCFPIDFSLNEIENVHITKNQNPSNLIKSSSGRYTYIMSQCKTIATIAAKSSTNFNKAAKALENLQIDLESNDNKKIIEEKSARPGRNKKKANRIKRI